MAAQKDIREALEMISPDKIFYDEPMSRHTSLCVGGKATALVIIEDEGQLAEAIRNLKKNKIAFFPAGNLTNVIVRDGGYRGVILLMKGMKKISIRHVEKDHFLVDAEAGASLSSVVSMAAAQELTGMEFCTGIPGSVGGAVRMNAGAYGREIKDVVSWVSLLGEEGEKKQLSRDEITFSYRKTSLPAEAVVLSVAFDLEKGKADEIRGRMKEIMQWRQEKHPLEYPNAGSIFKNIPGQPAGRIIEELGLKGKRAGEAQISPKHANFIVNTGKATAADVLELMAFVQKEAKEKKGIILEPEVVIIGEAQ